MISHPIATMMKSNSPPVHDCNCKTVKNMSEVQPRILGVQLTKIFFACTMCLWWGLIICQNDICRAADLTSKNVTQGGRPETEIPHSKAKINHSNTIWGEIVDSPLGTRSLYKENDLVYVRCSNSKLGMIREGDRFGILPHPVSRYCNRYGVHQSRINKPLEGQIEITNVGSDLITGIIVECHGLIKNGYLIFPLVKASRPMSGTVLRN
ncbi:MAG: hypothetical protein ACP5U1_04875 [Desulfomonilaceae bacterium]